MLSLDIPKGSLAPMLPNVGFLSGQLLVFVLVLARVTGLMMTAPIFGTQAAPMQARALLAVAVSLLAMPLAWGRPAPVFDDALSPLIFIGAESLVGVALGLAVTIVFEGVQLAAHLVGVVSGVQASELYDPMSETSGPVFGQILFYVMLAVFVFMGGHRKVLAALLDTFYWMPPGAAGFPDDLAHGVTTLIAQSFIMAIRAAAPTMSALMLANLVLGFVTRTLPQVNLQAVGFPLNSLLTIGMLGVSLGAIAWIFQEQVDPALEIVLEAFSKTATLPATGA